MLNVDSARACTSKVTNEFLAGRRVLEGIIRQNAHQTLRIRFQSSTRELPG